MRVKKKCYVCLFVVVFIMTVMNAGCRKAMTTANKKERIKELLKEKYGEEFEVRNLYYSGAVHAWCYPINDSSMIFMADTSEKMEEIQDDQYIQKIVCTQLDNSLNPEFDSIFSDCFVSTNIFSGGTDKFLSIYDKKEICFKTLMQFFRSQGISDDIVVNVFINKDLSTTNNTLVEYNSIVEIAGRIQEEGEYPYVSIHLYFCDLSQIINVRKAIENYNWEDSESSDQDIYDVIKDIPKIKMLFDKKGDSFIISEGERTELDYTTYNKQRGYCNEK